MKKNFLLLLLMTLLPLAGWAAVPIIDNEYDVNVVPSDGSAVWCGGKPTVQAGWVIVQSETAQKPTKAQVAEQIEIRDLANYNVGNHPYALQLKAGANGYVDIATSEENHYNRYYLHTNAQNTATLTITKYTGDPIIDASLLGYVNDELTYNTFEQALLSGGATATANSVDVPVIYTLNPSGNPLVTFDSYANVKGTNAGEYTVYFKVAETDDYAGTDWIPMAGHKDIAQASQDFTAEGAVPTANTWIYDAQAHALAIAPTAPVQYGTYEYCATNSTNDADWTTDLSGFKATSNNDTKTVWWRVKVEGGNYEGHDATQLTATITKATPTFTTEPTFAEDFPYDGQTHQLITDPGVAEFNATPSFALRYKRAGSNTWSEWSSWSENYELRTAKNAAVYEIAYCTKTTADLNKPESIYKTITVSKIDIPAESFNAPEAKTGLIYNGAPKELVTEASWVGDAYGDILYSLNGTDWDADVPTGNAAGNYTVYFKIDPVKYYSTFSNYNEYVAPQAITVTIAQATITTFTEPVAKTGLKADGATYELVEAASWGENPESGSFSYSLDGENWGADVPQASEAGDYTVYFKMTPNDATNYSEFTNSYAVTIGGYIPVYIVPTAAQKYYGTEDPASFEYTVVNANTSATLDNSVLKGAVSLARTNGNAIGTYKIYVKDYTPAAEDGDYTVVNILNNPASEDAANKTAVFTILVDPNAELKLNFTAAAIANKASKVYDGTTSIEALGFTVDDLEADETTLIGEDTWESLKGSATVVFALAAENGNAQETQVTATVSGGLTARYATVTVTPMDFEITPAAITLYAKDQAIDWSADPTAQPNTTVEDATVAIAVGALKGSDVLTDVVASVNIASTNVGNNNITLTAANNTNYTITVNKDADNNDKIGNLAITGAATIALGAGGNDLQTIKDYAGRNVNVTIDFTARNGRQLPDGTPRTWTANTWVTLTLPFNISVANLSKALGYAIVNVIDPSRTEVSGTSSKFYGKLTMNGGNGDGTEDYLVANKPFLVKTADDIANVNGGVIDFGTQTIVAPTDLSVEAGGGAKFTGTYATKNVTSADNAAIWFMIGGNRQSWAYITTTSSAEWDILPFEGFIDMSSLSAQARSNMTFYFEEIDGSTTAIKSVSTDNLGSNKLDAKGWYNLNGMKMDGAPLQKGIYIKDGKKVVIK